MKRVVLLSLFFVLLLPATLQAQTSPIDQKSWILGGSASFTSQGSDADDDRATSLFISPQGQYFVLPGLAIGGTALLSYTTREDVSTTGVGAGPTISYFFGRGERTIYPFISGRFTITSLRVEVDPREIIFDTGIEIDPQFVPGFDRTTTSYMWDVSAGVAVMVAKNVALTGALFYQQDHVDTGIDLPAGGGDLPIVGGDLDRDMFGFRVGIAAFVF